MMITRYAFLSLMDKNTQKREIPRKKYPEKRNTHKKGQNPDVIVISVFITMMRNRYHTSITDYKKAVRSTIHSHFFFSSERWSLHCWPTFPAQYVKYFQFFSCMSDMHVFQHLCSFSKLCSLHLHLPIIWHLSYLSKTSIYTYIKKGFLSSVMISDFCPTADPLYSQPIYLSSKLAPISIRHRYP